MLAESSSISGAGAVTGPSLPEYPGRHDTRAPPTCTPTASAGPERSPPTSASSCCSSPPAPTCATSSVPTRPPTSGSPASSCPRQATARRPRSSSRGWRRRGSRTWTWTSSASRSSPGRTAKTPTCWSATWPAARPGSPSRTRCPRCTSSASRPRCPTPPQTLAGPVLRELRMRKDAAEVDELRAAGAAIDRVHARMAEFVKAGRTEAQVGADIAAAIVEEGHTEAAFVIVGSGPNGASPHHDVSDRVIEVGDVVVDRHRRPAAERLQLRLHPHLRRRPRALGVGCSRGVRRAAARPGARRGERAARRDGRAGRRRRPRVITEAGLGERFIHRTGHGIGHRRARGALHRRRQRPAAGAGHGLLRGARGVPRRRVGRAHRGHRRGHRATGSSGSTSARATWSSWTEVVLDCGIAHDAIPGTSAA